MSPQEDKETHTLLIFCRLLKRHSKAQHTLESFLDSLSVLLAVFGGLREIVHVPSELVFGALWGVEEANNTSNLIEVRSPHTIWDR